MEKLDRELTPMYGAELVMMIGTLDFGQVAAVNKPCCIGDSVWVTFGYDRLEGGCPLSMLVIADDLKVCDPEEAQM